MTRELSHLAEQPVQAGEMLLVVATKVVHEAAKGERAVFGERARAGQLHLREVAKGSDRLRPRRAALFGRIRPRGLGRAADPRHRVAVERDEVGALLLEQATDADVVAVLLD